MKNVLLILLSLNSLMWFGFFWRQIKITWRLERELDKFQSYNTPYGYKKSNYSPHQEEWLQEALNKDIKLLLRLDNLMEEAKNQIRLVNVAQHKHSTYRSDIIDSKTEIMLQKLSEKINKIGSNSVGTSIERYLDANLYRGHK